MPGPILMMSSPLRCGLCGSGEVHPTQEGKVLIRGAKVSDGLGQWSQCLVCASRLGEGGYDVNLSWRGALDQEQKQAGWFCTPHPDMADVVPDIGFDAESGFYGIFPAGSIRLSSHLLADSPLPREEIIRRREWVQATLDWREVRRIAQELKLPVPRVYFHRAACLPDAAFYLEGTWESPQIAVDPSALYADRPGDTRYLTEGVIFCLGQAFVDWTSTWDEDGDREGRELALLARTRQVAAFKRYCHARWCGRSEHVAAAAEPFSS